MASKPTHEQAQLHLQIYEERRDPRLRQARDWFFANCFADTLDEAMRIAPPGTEAGTNFMMVISYWDQACALLNYGLLHDDLFFETSGEFFGVWNRIKPTIRRVGNGSRTSSLPPTSKRQQTVSKRWAENTLPWAHHLDAPDGPTNALTDEKGSLDQSIYIHNPMPPGVPRYFRRRAHLIKITFMTPQGSS